MHWFENVCFKNSKQHLKEKAYMANIVMLHMFCTKIKFIISSLNFMFYETAFIREDYYIKELDSTIVNNTIVWPRSYRS